MTKSSWSLRSCLAVAAFMSIAGQQLYGQATLVTTNPAGGSRAPVLTSQPPSRIPANVTTAGFDFDAKFFSSNYYSISSAASLAPNPDIAIGPDDILEIVGNQWIGRFQNPKTGTGSGLGWCTPATPDDPDTCSPSSASIGIPTSKVLLSTWLGAALNTLCPTTSRTVYSCIISNASVRYDQMQGRFVVLFSVVDTGATSGIQAITQGPVTKRTANWVMIVSNFASLVVGTSSTTNYFTVNPPTTSTGGVATAAWTIFYGGDGIEPTSATTAGNVNTISPGGAPYNGIKAYPDCTAAPATGAPCYIPTDVRVGFDNDDVIVTATVFDDNALPLGNRLATSAVQMYAGTRVRVYKKAAVYNLAVTLPLAPGDGVTAANLVQGAYYDLFPAGAPWVLAGTDGTGLQLVYEPNHLRGRALATYSGYANRCFATGTDGATTTKCGVTYLLGSYADALPTTPASSLIVQPITYTTVLYGSDVNNPGPTAAPGFKGGIPSLATATSIGVPNYWQAGWTVTNGTSTFVGVPQAIERFAPFDGSYGAGSIASAAMLYVGDARPSRVISREGLIYDARVGLDQSVAGGTFNPAVSSYTTTMYDIINTNQANPNVTARTAVPPFAAFKTEWANGNFFAPMFDVPADVLTYGGISPINVLPNLEKLFVAATYPPLPIYVSGSDTRGTTTAPFSATQGKYASINNCRQQEPGLYSSILSFPGLWDFRCGEDAFDTQVATVNPFTGQRMRPNGTTDPFLYASRGGAGNDPNDLSMWMGGAYARGRVQNNAYGPGQWGTHISNYALSFPTMDPYGNPISGYTDVCTTVDAMAYCPYYSFIQIARQTEIAPGGKNPVPNTFSPGGLVTRAEMAYWVVRAQMDEQAINDYLTATGGAYCSFVDVCGTLASTIPTATSSTTPPAANWWRYVEVMYRRGYTKGCSGTSDADRLFCPALNLNRAQMSVFLIRAKMNSVFPTVTSGAHNTDPLQGPTNGDLYGLEYSGTPYFTDVTASDPQWGSYYWYIQKMRELRITNGETAGTFGPGDNLQRYQIAVFLVRAFFI